MKTLIFLIITVFLFTACSKDVESLAKSECHELGYSYSSEKKLNYRTGEYEFISMCKKS
jgi:hypothetical protein